MGVGVGRRADSGNVTLRASALGLWRRARHPLRPVDPSRANKKEGVLLCDQNLLGNTGLTLT